LEQTIAPSSSTIERRDSATGAFHPLPFEDRGGVLIATIATIVSGSVSQRDLRKLARENPPSRFKRFISALTPFEIS
jgi:hypothetical protein